MENNQLSSIDAIAFQDLSNLKYLYLDDNQFTSIVVNALQSLSNLSSINANTFHGLASIEGLSNLLNLYLDGNNISSFDANTFKGLLNLKTLNLCHNFLKLVVSKFLKLNSLFLLLK